MMLNDDWNNNWELFAESLVAALQAGADLGTLESQYCDQEVTWMGTVHGISIGETTTRISLAMHKVSFTLDGRKCAISPFLIVLLRYGERDLWSEVKVGDSVAFKCFIKPSQGGPFPSGGFRWFDSSEDERLLSVSIASPKLTSIVS